MANHISKPVHKVDNKVKLSGSIHYVGDMHPEGMLYARTLRSERARAIIKSIYIPEIPEGYYVVDKSDVPGHNRVKQMFDDQPFFAEERVNYIGEPILLVVGADKQIILELMSQIKVEYEDVKPILSIEDAKRGVAEPIYGDKHYFVDYNIKKGDVDSSFKDAYKIIEDEYSTGYQEHAYLETQGALGIYEADKVTVYASTQCPYHMKEVIVHMFGWSEDRVRVVQSTIGGGFGGKEDYPSVLGGQVALAAFKTKKPVQLIFDRIEDITASTKRHPSKLKYKTALSIEGKILGMRIEIALDGGAYATLSGVVLQRAIFASIGVYNIKNLSVNGRVFATNTVVSGAFRGFGCPQAIYGIESHMTRLAAEVGISPLEFKKQYIVKKGDSTCTSGLFRYDVKLPEMIDKIEEMSTYSKKFKLYNKDKKNGSSPYRGVGISLFLHGCGYTGNGERDFIKAVVKARKLLNGDVELLLSNVDMGQGLQTTFRKIMCEVLGLPMDRIIYNNPDTDRVPDSGPTVASRSIMIVGKLVEEAAHEIKERWDEAPEFEVVKKYKHPDNLEWDQDKFYGDAYPTYSWGVNVVEIEIDPITFEINIKGVWNVFDVGNAIDERIMRGQIEGGVLQGIGYGSIEVMNQKDGKLMQRSLTDYIIPTSKDITRMETKLISNPYDQGPYGAKGAGEITLVGGAAAIASAVSNALGIKISKIPVTPEYLMGVMNNG